MTVANFLIHEAETHQAGRNLSWIFDFFITFCTHKQQTLLANSSVHDSFRRFSISAEERNIFVGRYVIMPDHIHFFVHFGDAVQISIWMKSLKNSLSKTLRSLGNPAPHWQRDILII
jgi:REP element-mobilizing transposase RayT